MWAAVRGEDNPEMGMLEKLMACDEAEKLAVTFEVANTPATCGTAVYVLV